MLKTINILAAAAYPWKTGTAILALNRAFYLAQRGLDVRLYVPWIPPDKQELVYGHNRRFDSFKAQEDCMQSYLPGDCPSLGIEFYPATYIYRWGSIVPTCTISGRIRNCDWLILEEPEHLNWKHPWNRYHKRASRVTGIVLTNYSYYFKFRFRYRPHQAWFLNAYNRWLIRYHCDDIILHGNGIPPLANSQNLNTSGIHHSFFQFPIEPDSKKIYFMGKLIWEKGFRELVDLLSTTEIREIDIFGSGFEKEPIAAYAKSKGISFHYKGNSVNPAEDLKGYKIFINASRSDLNCTTTFEALGQGRFVILPEVAGNDTFYQFKNCLAYSSPREFKKQLKYALDHFPEKDEQINSLTWEAATERLLQYYEGTFSKRSVAAPHVRL